MKDSIFKYIRGIVNLAGDNGTQISSTQLPFSKHGIDTASYFPSGYQDAFGRLRISQPTTLFDSKQIHDNQPLFWDDQSVSGGGTATAHSTLKAASTISVSNNTAGKRVRQTFQRFNYQPGKSMLVIFTTTLTTSAIAETGITREVGYFDDNNGIFLRFKDGLWYMVRRTNVTGTPADNAKVQSDWNLDTMDGSGPSGVTLDPTKAQIFFLDFEWLGVGRVRMGFFIDGNPIYCHEFLNANNLASVYMSTPNLPLRYSIENSGTGPAASLDQICSTVISEGGLENNGILRHADSGGVTVANIGTLYPVLGIRLKTAYPGLNVLLESLSLITTSPNDVAHWELRLNPTITLNGGAFTYADQTNSGVQIAVSSNGAPTAAGGTEVDGGYFNQTLPVTAAIPNARRLGFSIAGTQDEIVLCVRPITTNISLQASITWRELS